MATRFSRMFGLLAVTLQCLLWSDPGQAQQAHHVLHAMGAASGIPHGIPRLCADASAIAVQAGAWSSPATWSTHRVPGPGEGVRIEAGTQVDYDVVSDAALKCVEIGGRLVFRTTAPTRLKVGSMMVLQGGFLEIGSEAKPISPQVVAEVIFADQPLDVKLDPEQFGGGLVGLGRISIHGAPKNPTFVRLTAEPKAGQRLLQLAEDVSGWTTGDKLVLPDTRQLKRDESREDYAPQWEEFTVAGLSGRTVTLSHALAYPHAGARSVAGELDALPHVGNVTRNVILRSENASGRRGHVIFVGRPDVDIRYASFAGLGRTRAGVLDSTTYGTNGQVLHVGTNQIGRYSLHFHHVFGPEHPTAGGYQFTVIGNAIDGASKWGITVHNSHYGLIRDNVVYDSHGAGIVTEDGTESFNVFAHNFILRSVGSGEFAPASGYGAGPTPDPGGEGAGIWMRGPNNYVRDNVAANVDVFGFGIAAGWLGAVRIPSSKGADPGKPRQGTLVDTTAMEVLEFKGNEAYGAMQTGIAIGWNATLSDAHVWHVTRNAVTAFPADRLTIERFVARGDGSVLTNQFENPTGIWFSNYAGKDVIVRNADIQGMRVGIASPFSSTDQAEQGRGRGAALIENSYLRNYVGIAVATGYAPQPGAKPVKRVIVRNSRFEALPIFATGRYPPGAISMNYGMSANDPRRRDPIAIYGFNNQQGDDFHVFYSNGLPESAAPCTDASRDGIRGFVCGIQDGRHD